MNKWNVGIASEKLHAAGVRVHHADENLESRLLTPAGSATGGISTRLYRNQLVAGRYASLWQSIELAVPWRFT